MKYPKLVLFTSMLAVSLSLIAGPTDTLRSYSCDFEDTLQNLQWKFPKADNVGHYWCVDTAINNGGRYGMYVTADGGLTPSYKTQSALVVAYTDIILRKSTDKYLLSFDWLAAGYTFLENDGLYVFWIPEVDPDLGDTIRVKSYSTNAIPTDWEPYALPLNAQKGVNYLRGKSTWQAWLSANSGQGSDSRLTAKGKLYRLVFAWRSGVDGPVNPAACIDNIVIADPRACRAPKSLKIDKHGKDSLIMSWKRDTCCQNYEVGVYSYEDSVWIVNETTDTFFVHQVVPEGFCDFYVRTKCQDTISGDWFYSAKVQSSDFIYYPDNHCVDYITMTDKNCYTSKFHKDDPETKSYKTQYVTDDYHFMQEMVDNGSDEISSRHTHHYSKIETDPRTGGRLKTVPAGELCSSRLGNWNNGGEAERAEFKFHVDAKKNPIMILKYAVVLESPGHDVGKTKGVSKDLQDPRFTLDILDNGQSIGDCASADFTSSWVKEGWHDTTVTIPPDPGRENPTKLNVVWKDWTTIGVNLRQYDGKTLTIRLTTYDCSMTAHFGYAYFVLGCSSDDLDLTGESCSGNPVEEFNAPNGFNYRWYQKRDTLKEHIFSREQKFTIAEIDTFTYCVDVLFPEDSACYFVLEASSQPHVPVSAYTWEYLPKDCKHYVKVKNNAHVLHIKKWEEGAVIRRDTTITQIDTCYWSWGKLPNPGLLLPGDSVVIPIDVAGNYPIALTTTYRNCETTVYDTLRIPELDTTSVVVDTLILRGDSVYFKGKYYKEEGFYPFRSTNYQGCEKTDYLSLEIHENISVQCSDPVLCYGATEGQLPYTMTGVRRGTRYSLVFDDSSIQRYDRLPIPTDEDVLNFALPANLQPDYYPFTLTFHDSLTGKSPIIVDWSGRYTLTVRYPSDLLTQRWNDVLAVKKAEFNAGAWTFTAYQWYKDGQPIEGATGDYLYQALDSTSEYQVMLTRDNVQLISCAYSPVLLPSTTDMLPTIVDRNASVPMRTCGLAQWYDYSGMLVQSESYDASSITAPAVPGLYILHLTPQITNHQSPITNPQPSILRILVR